MSGDSASNGDGKPTTTTASPPPPPVSASAMDAHNAAVARIAAQVQSFHARQAPFRIYHGSTNSTRHSARRADNTIDTSRLTHVLSISVDDSSRGGTALVEPNVPMDALVRATLPHGLVPPSSWSSPASPRGRLLRHVRREQLLPLRGVRRDGALRRAGDARGARRARGQARPQAGPVLGRGVGVWHPRRRDAARGGAAPGVQVRPLGVLAGEGRGGDGARGSSSHRRRHHPLEDYLFRYDRGGFWVARYAFNYFITPFNRVTRFLLDRYMHARVMYRALHKSGLGDYYMVQDVGVPYDRVPEFQAWLDGSLDIYPLWLCPLRVRRPGGPSAAHGLHAEFADPDRAPDLMNFGVWGPVRGDRRAVVAQNRALEQKVQELGGKKWLYAHAYYTEEEFWAHYDRASYDALRERYGAGYLPSVYDKVRVDVDAEEAARNRTWKTRAKARAKGVWPLRGWEGEKVTEKKAEAKANTEPAGEEPRSEQEAEMEKK
ncbi:hypothetical protein ACCO45_007691 [Purpureocillium lilacinum]|uniref:Uncharacterized protein n=1 Tax=Purpureocillium lilacinum TaxID=33203 RepID=A0ACC4DP83_PURLI